jgi:hypothetical protein
MLRRSSSFAFLLAWTPSISVMMSLSLIPALSRSVLG